jgi:hypothetical protein
MDIGHVVDGRSDVGTFFLRAFAILINRMIDVDHLA